jgi:hypothetical protein
LHTDVPIQERISIEYFSEMPNSFCDWFWTLLFN